jgi:hypothetical protein
MEQAKKSSFLSRTMSSLEDQVAVLKSRITQLEDGNTCMTKILEGACEHLNCKFYGFPLCFAFWSILLILSLLEQVLAWMLCWGSSSECMSCSSWESFGWYRVFLVWCTKTPGYHSTERLCRSYWKYSGGLPKSSYDNPDSHAPEKSASR